VLEDNGGPAASGGVAGQPAGMEGAGYWRWTGRRRVATR
jgi:hypothetical protein